MDVPDCRQEMADGLRVNINQVVANGDGGDLGTRIERDDVSVEPAEGGGAICGDRWDQVIWYGEEKGDIGVQEGANDGWVGIFKTERAELQGINGSGNAVRWYWWRWRQVSGGRSVRGGVGRRVGDTNGGEGDCEREETENEERKSEGDEGEEAGKHGGWFLQFAREGERDGVVRTAQCKGEMRGLRRRHNPHRVSISYAALEWRDGFWVVPLAAAQAVWIHCGWVHIAIACPSAGEYIMVRY